MCKGQFHKLSCRYFSQHQTFVPAGFVYFVNSSLELIRNMHIRFTFLLALVAVLSGCKDAPPSTVVTDPIPAPVPSPHIIDTYYYVQFTWGRGNRNDTVTMEIPDQGNGWTNDQYVNIVNEEKSEVILRPNELDSTIYDTVGWCYAPQSIMYPYDYAVQFEDEDNSIYDLPEPLKNPPTSEEDKVSAYNKIFWMSFPWRNKDTIQFWDVADYLSNPYIKEGATVWGRVGNSIPNDSVFNDDQRDGVVLHYIDEEGRLWESDNPPTFQPFGYFEIEERTQNFRNGRSYFEFEGKMAARLYNSVGEFKELKGGIFRVMIMDDITLSDQPK